MALVKYIGAKAQKVDRLHGSRAVWAGNGDVVEVKDEIAHRMVSLSPSVYEIVKEVRTAPKLVPRAAATKDISVLETTTIAMPDGREVALIDAPRKQLAAYASDELGLAIEDGHTRELILAFIANYEKVTARAQVADPTGTDPAKGNGASPQQPRASDTAADRSGAEAGSAGSAVDAGGDASVGTGDDDPGLPDMGAGPDPLAALDASFG